MIIQPKVRGFICITAHPTGCAKQVQDQIEYVRRKGALTGMPRRVLVIGASTGYGLASRIVPAFAGSAATLGVFFERPSENGKPASPGWYNSCAFEQAGRAERGGSEREERRLHGGKAGNLPAAGGITK